MIKVAIVEDNKTVREGFATLLNRTAGFQCVCTCGSVAEALKKIPRAAPDVILMDIQLPDSTGVECTAKIKEQMPKVHIVIVTVYEDSERIFQALRAGACGYLLKPVRLARLQEAIHEVLAGGAPMSMSIARRVVQTFQKLTSAAGEEAELWPREREILQLLAQGFLKKEIADKLDISYWTVQTHVRRIYKKLHVHSRAQAVAK